MTGPVTECDLPLGDLRKTLLELREDYELDNQALCVVVIEALRLHGFTAGDVMRAVAYLWGDEA